nr:reverse transcriptase domain-containing protein [Tanacetum cinerariifolium]
LGQDEHLYNVKAFYREEPPTDLELKPLPDNLEYVFLEEPSFLPVIISSQLSKEKKNELIFVLKKHKQAFAWKITDIPGIYPSFCKHKIQLLDNKKPFVQKQRRKTYSRLSGRGLSSRSVGDSESEFSSAVIAMNSSNSAKISSSRRVPSMEWRILIPSSKRASKSSSKI